MDKEKISGILKEAKVIAVVGISRNKDKTSRRIAKYMYDNGYQVVGINPNGADADEIPVFRTLEEVPYQIDIVDVFRKSEDIPNIIEEVKAVNPKILWLQLGIQNDKAVELLNDTDIEIVQDTCIKVYHQENIK